MGTFNYTNAPNQLAAQLSQAPLNSVLEAVTGSILKTQEKLNQESLSIAQRMAGAEPSDQVLFGRHKYSLLELGFVPEFYQLGETQVNLKMALQLAHNNQGVQIYSQLLNERNFLSGHFTPDAASEIRATLVPTNAPGLFEKRVAQMLEDVTEQAFDGIKAQLIAHTAQNVSLNDLAKAGISDALPENLSRYQARLNQLHPDELPHIPALQQLVTRTNAFAVIADYVAKRDLRPLVMEALFAAGVNGAVERNLAHYRARLAEMTSVSDDAALQTAVEQANSLAQIISFLQLRTVNAITADLLTSAGVTDLDNNNMSSYLNALGQIALASLDALTLSGIQAVIDAANNNVNG
ncbi:hypothetical protein [Alteromonas sp. a30]|uniref:hypothetical protein n=1 Tax=Alteromonas sp. a30 TaxID=2730917 RepID=UPI00227DE516|nr:hypothetical protein [Alteromonas sp. a30]MCY7294203.1 hypothetical protein [Alteromonas sp. a30]